MATRKSQRIFIWVIAVVMTVGTLGAYAAVILANENPQTASDDQMQAQIEEFQRQQEEAARESAAAAQPLEGYEADAFDADAVTELETSDLKEGDGEEVPEGATVTVSYFGWTPDGKIFDSSNKNGTNTPAEGFELAEGSLIEGWVKGIPGMKEGGVRKLIIPADQAYGETGSPPNIAPNTPLAFIVRVESVE